MADLRVSIFLKLSTYEKGHNNKIRFQIKYDVIARQDGTVRKRFELTGTDNLKDPIALFQIFSPLGSLRFRTVLSGLAMDSSIVESRMLLFCPFHNELII